MELSKLTPKQLLQYHSSIIKELRRRDIVRTNNNPLGDYSEWLVAQTLKLTLAANSKQSFDAISDTGERVQVKSCRMTENNKTGRLSTIRHYEQEGFDYLVALLFDEDYSLLGAYKLSHALVGEYARYQPSVNGINLWMKGAIMQDERLEHLDVFFDDKEVPR